MANIKQDMRDASWHNEPASWELTDAVLTITTGNKSDFWQDTYYGFHRDDGHFLGRDITGDFTTVLRFEADYVVLYDQAGLMMRADARNWLKTGIEFSDDVTNFSTVVTRDGRSDWSVIGLPRMSGIQSIRLTRCDAAVITHYLGKDGKWQLMRLADFPKAAAVRVGPMACSPERSGLVARFHDVRIGPAIEDPLHAT